VAAVTCRLLMRSVAVTPCLHIVKTDSQSVRRRWCRTCLVRGLADRAGWLAVVRLWAMRLAESSDPAARSVARPGAGGVVSRLGLWERLGKSARMTVVSAPPGSGKTTLLRSWIGEAGLAGRAAWVTVERDERDPQRLWLAVLDALRKTAPGSALIRELTAAPDLDGWTVVERLLKDLAPLADRLWLVLDDLHELGSAEALRQLELLVMRAPEELRLVLATRHDVRLGLHRLRLEGELTEIRAGDLRFSVDEARALFQAAGKRWPTRPPPGSPSSARWTWPNLTERSCGSRCIPHRACSSATLGSTPHTPP
jgi:AAA domain